MENPIISVMADNFVMVRKHAQSLAVQVSLDDSPLKSLICSFLRDDQELYAAVIAPDEDHQQLARRVVSFLGAYMRINDADEMEYEVLRCIETCLRKRNY